MEGTYSAKERAYGATTVYEYPSTLLRVTSKDLEEMLKEAEKRFKEDDFIQSCEKFYKIAEEVVKVLAEFYAPQTIREVTQRISNGRPPWNTGLLYRAVEEITTNPNVFNDEEAEIFRNGWRSAMDLHRDCFHDFLLTPSMIEDAIKEVKEMLNVSKNVLKRLETLLLSSATVNEFS